MTGSRTTRSTSAHEVTLVVASVVPPTTSLPNTTHLSGGENLDTNTLQRMNVILLPRQTGIVQTPLCQVPSLIPMERPEISRYFGNL